MKYLTKIYPDRVGTMIIKLFCPVVVFTILNIQAYAQFDWDSQSKELTPSDFTYRLIESFSIVEGVKYPVIVALHGSGGTSTMGFVEQYAGTNLRNTNPAYVICQGSGHLAPDQRDIICNIIADLPNADNERIYIIGFSAGGAASWGFIQAYPDYFAGAVLMASVNSRISQPDVKKLGKTAIWIFSGDQDAKFHSHSVALLNNIKGTKANVKFTTFFNESHKIARKCLNYTGISPQGKTEYVNNIEADKNPVVLDWLFAQ
jgi:predicted peptidase